MRKRLAHTQPTHAAQRAHMGDGCPNKPRLLTVKEVELMIETKCRNYTDTIESEIAKYNRLLEREQRRIKQLEQELADIRHQPKEPPRPVHRNPLAVADWNQALL